MKKNITLMSLVLGVMLLVSLNAVSATTGSITITDVDFNGQPNIVVDPSENVDVEVTVYASMASGPSDPSNDWKSTKYKIEGGSEICINVPEPDYIYSGTYADTFTITAPANAGVYDFEVQAFKQEVCADGSSNNYLAGDAITVVAPDTQAPVISLITGNPQYPTCSSDVQVCATITDASALSFVDITCKAGSTTVTKEDVVGIGGLYCATFSASTMGASDNEDLVCGVIAQDTHGNNAVQNQPDPIATYDCANPIADFTCNPLSGDEDLSVSCTSNSHDSVTPDNELDYSWTFGNGQTSTSEDPSLTYTEDGLYTVSLTVTDNAGHSNTETKTGYINVLDIGPSASFSESAHEFGESQSVSFTDTSISHDPVLSRSWDFGDGQTSTEQNPSHTYADNGIYTVTLTVCDEDHDCDSDTATKTVTNEAPNVNAGEYTCNEGETISLNAATATDVAADYPLVFEWDLNGDDTYETSGQVVSYTCGNGDAILDDVVSLKVTDNDGGWNTDDAKITINNVPPTANAHGPYNAVIDNSVCFFGSATDIIDTSFTYQWDFNYDGSFNVDSTEQNPCSAVYSTLGDHTIALKVHDGNNYSEIVTTKVTVYDYAIHLNAGWNLISIPLVPEDTSINFVFSSILDKVAYHGADVATVLQYDAVLDKWYKATPNGEEPTGFNWASSSKLEKVIPGYGYYIEMKEEAILYLNGKSSYLVDGLNTTPVFGVPPSVTLGMDSWNLIGVYGKNNPSVYNALVSLTDEEGHKYYDIIYDKNGGSNPSNLNSEEGYWISIKKIFAGDETIEYKANYGGAEPD